MFDAAILFIIKRGDTPSGLSAQILSGAVGAGACEANGGVVVFVEGGIGCRELQSVQAYGGVGVTSSPCGIPIVTTSTGGVVAVIGLCTIRIRCRIGIGGIGLRRRHQIQDLVPDP